MTSTPAWIRRPDGQVIAFDSQRISQSLFAASSALGQPNAFLARELTDGVVHFFSLETAGSIATTTQLAELIEKVVRELGHPQLAKAYADRSQQLAADASSSSLVWESRFAKDVKPFDVARASLREYSLRVVYSPDLASAHQEGLLTFPDCDQPSRMRAAVIEAWGRPGLDQSEFHVLLLEARARAERLILVDGPEHWFGNGSPEAAAQFWKTLASHQDPAEKRAFLVQINIPAPREEMTTPLFGDPVAAARPLDSAVWVDAWLGHGSLASQIDWHLGKGQTLGAAPPSWFRSWARQPERWSQVRFFFQRTRKMVRLGEGLHRGKAGILGLVGLNLPLMARWPGVEGDPERFLAKLPSLIRMGVAAGVQCRNYLRRQPHLQAGFVTERAPWQVAPIGLDAVVAKLLGADMTTSPNALDFGVRIVQTMLTCLNQEARQTHLEVPLENGSTKASSDSEACWGMMTGLAGVTPQRQLQAVAALHQAAEGGFAWIRLHADPLPNPDELWQLLQSAAKIGVGGLGFCLAP